MKELVREEEIDRYIFGVLDGKSLNSMTTYLKELGRGRFVEERYLELYLRDKSNRASEEPIVRGLYFAGRGRWIKPWMEIHYFYGVNFQKEKGKTRWISLSNEGLDVSLFRLLAQIIPPGGHLTVEYEEDETSEVLELGIPAAVSPLGYLMWKGGFRWFKNWYFPEGGREGGTKLQGNKPLDESNRREQERKTSEELKKFLKSLPSLELGKIGKHAAQRARDILAEIERESAFYLEKKVGRRNE